MSAASVGYIHGFEGCPPLDARAFVNEPTHRLYMHAYANGTKARMLAAKATSKWREPPPPQETPYPRGMSKDRVVFQLRESYFLSEKPCKLLKRVFGMTETDFYWARQRMRDTAVASIAVVCRPSQFARFLILRNEAGLQNQFKELAAKLHHPNDTFDWDVDVSANKPY